MAVIVLVATDVALAMGVGELRVGVRDGVDDAPIVGVGVDAVFVGVGEGMVVGVAVGEGTEVGVGVVVVVGVGDSVAVGVGVKVLVGVGEGVAVGVDVSVILTVCFITEFVAKVALAAIEGVLVNRTTAPVNENSDKVMESTPISSLLGVSLASLASSERCFVLESDSGLFFIVALMKALRSSAVLV
jgi:hypothetical protein